MSLAALALTVAVLHAELARGDTSTPILTVTLVDFVDLPTLSRRTLETEVERILARAGRELEWRTYRPGTDHEPRAIPVVLLARDHPVHGRRGQVLGAAETRMGRPTAWVYVQAVGRAAGIGRLPRPSEPAAQRALGEALGRVVAHELVHVISPSTPHAAGGLMVPVFDAHVLVGRRPRLDPTTIDLLHAGVACGRGPGHEGRGTDRLDDR